MTHKVPYFSQTRDLEIMKRIISGDHPEWVAGEGIGETESSIRKDLRNLCEICWEMKASERPSVVTIISRLNTVRILLYPSSIRALFGTPTVESGSS